MVKPAEGNKVTRENKPTDQTSDDGQAWAVAEAEAREAEAKAKAEEAKAKAEAEAEAEGEAVAEGDGEGVAEGDGEGVDVDSVFTDTYDAALEEAEETAHAIDNNANPNGVELMGNADYTLEVGDNYVRNLSQDEDGDYFYNGTLDVDGLAPVPETHLSDVHPLDIVAVDGINSGDVAPEQHVYYGDNPNTPIGDTIYYKDGTYRTSTSTEGGGQNNIHHGADGTIYSVAETSDDIGYDPMAPGGTYYTESHITQFQNPDTGEVLDTPATSETTTTYSNATWLPVNAREVATDSDGVTEANFSYSEDGQTITSSEFTFTGNDFANPDRANIGVGSDWKPADVKIVGSDGPSVPRTETRTYPDGSRVERRFSDKGDIFQLTYEEGGTNPLTTSFIRAGHDAAATSASPPGRGHATLDQLAHTLDNQSGALSTLYPSGQFDLQTQADDEGITTEQYDPGNPVANVVHSNGMDLGQRRNIAGSLSMAGAAPEITRHRETDDVIHLSSSAPIQDNNGNVVLNRHRLGQLQAAGIEVNQDDVRQQAASSADFDQGQYVRNLLADAGYSGIIQTSDGERLVKAPDEVDAVA